MFLKIYKIRSKKCLSKYKITPRIQKKKQTKKTINTFKKGFKNVRLINSECKWIYDNCILDNISTVASWWEFYHDIMIEASTHHPTQIIQILNRASW